MPTHSDLRIEIPRPRTFTVRKDIMDVCGVKAAVLYDVLYNHWLDEVYYSMNDSISISQLRQITGFSCATIKSCLQKLNKNLIVPNTICRGMVEYSVQDENYWSLYYIWPDEKFIREAH